MNSEMISSLFSSEVPARVFIAELWFCTATAEH